SITTTKHLALASQSLPVRISLIRIVRETFRWRLLKQAIMLVELTRSTAIIRSTRRRFTWSIMGDRLTTHIKNNAIM
ncbi:hypothetical protein BJV78DRAFT_1192629, partial [Lactifluus subvellereus]